MLADVEIPEPPFTTPATQLADNELIAHLEQCKAEFGARMQVADAPNSCIAVPILRILHDRIQALEREGMKRELLV
jgi:hypothetical protein